MRSFSNWLSRFVSCRREPRLQADGRKQRLSAARGNAPSSPKPGESLRGHAAADCELQWRPSRGLALALILLGALGGVSAWVSELPQSLSLPIAGLALIWAIVSANRELRRPTRPLVIRGGRATLAGEAIADLRLHWRGWLARLDFTGPGGRRQRLLWWPDTLDATARRELRLAVAVLAPARATRSVAP